MEFGAMASILIAAFAFASTTLLFTLLRYSISTTKLLDWTKNKGLEPRFLCKLFQQLPGFHLPPQEEHLHLPRQTFHPCRFNAGCHPGETLLKGRLIAASLLSLGVSVPGWATAPSHPSSPGSSAWRPPGWWPWSPAPSSSSMGAGSSSSSMWVHPTSHIINVTHAIPHIN